MISIVYGRLAGVLAKIERANQQIAALIGDVGATIGSLEGHPFAMVIKADANGLPRSFVLTPRWEYEDDLRWGVIVGEIVHDLRSALEHLVWQLVEIGDGVQPDNEHTFPLYEHAETPESFRERVCRPAFGNAKHGPLYGIPEDAVPIIEAAQPYHGADTVSLTVLHYLWNTDKHQDLVPIALLGDEPGLWKRDAKLVAPIIISPVFGSRSMVVEVALEATGPNPSADLNTRGPYDLALIDGTSVINRLLGTAAFITSAIVSPLQQTFPAL